jgi:hypothetical protein
MITLCTNHATQNVETYLINPDGQTDRSIQESIIIEGE